MLQVQDGYVWGYRWDIFSWELVGGVGYEEASFTHSTISHNNTLGGGKIENNIYMKNGNTAHLYFFCVHLNDELLSQSAKNWGYVVLKRFSPQQIYFPLLIYAFASEMRKVGFCVFQKFHFPKSKVTGSESLCLQVGLLIATPMLLSL